MNRQQALEWLVENEPRWPVYIEKYITPRIVGNWRYVDTIPDRDIVFANGIEPCITQSDWLAATDNMTPKDEE